MSRLHLAIEQIVFARNYTIRLLDQTPPTEWFRQPPGGVSHIAWQVGHLAFAQYRMALECIRGPQPRLSQLLPLVRAQEPKRRRRHSMVYSCQRSALRMPTQCLAGTV